MQLIATVPFLGSTREVYLNPKSWSKINFDGQKFVVNKSIGTNFEKLNLEFNHYCKTKLKNIIESQISKLRQKSIEVELIYTDGLKTFPKKIVTSVNKYLKDIGYSQKIDYKIGKYEKEWGINEINQKSKTFILYFSQDLIKYDNGPNIEYVVAHELTHIFHRDHGDNFNQSLQRLFPKKRSSEEFFKTGISKRFNLVNIGSNNTVAIVLIAIISILLLYFGYQLLTNFLSQIFANFTGNNSQVRF